MLLRQKETNLSSSGRCSQRRMVRILLSRGITLQTTTKQPHCCATCWPKCACVRPRTKHGSTITKTRLCRQKHSCNLLYGLFFFSLCNSIVFQFGINKEYLFNFNMTAGDIIVDIICCGLTVLHVCICICFVSCMHEKQPNLSSQFLSVISLNTAAQGGERGGGRADEEPVCCSGEAIEEHASTNISTKARRRRRLSLPAPSL